MTTVPATVTTMNAFTPCARILPFADSRLVEGDAGSSKRLYALGAVNDFGWFAHVEMTAEAADPAPVSHPDVIVYAFILAGEGELVLGEGDPTFATEEYRFEKDDLIAIPRGITYRMTGTWTGIMFHARSSVYGTTAGTPRFPHPVVTRDAETGKRTCRYLDSLETQGVSFDYPDAPQPYDPSSGDFVDDASFAHAGDDVRQRTTPFDQQSNHEANNAMALRNPSVPGARVIKRSDTTEVYNANGGHSHWAYPLTWTDDLAIFIPHHHLPSSDAERPGDSHAHTEIEEFRYIVEGHGTCTFGEGDPTFDTEVHEFRKGDLVVTPKNVPHLDAGDYTAIAFHMKKSSFGVTPGRAQYPHPAYVYTKPPRPTEEERAATNDPGTYIHMDSRENINIYKPDPITSLEQNPTDLTHLRQDLFPSRAGNEAQGEW